MADSRLAIVQLLPALESGGVERGTLEIAAELVRRGHRSIVVSAGGRLVPELERGGSEHVNWPVGRKSLLTLRYVPQLRSWLRREQIDLVHARSRLPAWIAYAAWRKLPAATRPHFLTTVHGYYRAGHYSSIMTRGERVIAVSRSVRDYICATYPHLDPARIVVIPRGVDSSQYPCGYRPSDRWLQGWSAQYPTLANRWVLTLPGRLTRLKGHEDFLAIIGALRARHIPVHGLIVGGYHARKRKYYQELCKRIEVQELSEHVTLTGERADLREVLSVSAVVLSLSSQPESFGRTTLEALSIGRPVLGYAHGGVLEQLDAMFPAGAVTVGDWREAVERLALWYETPPVVAAENPYTLQRMLDRTLDVYTSLGSTRDRDGAKDEHIA